MIVADRLGIGLDDIEFLQGDTDDTPSGEGTGGSRSLQVAGPAVSEASDEVLVASARPGGRSARGRSGRRRARPGDRPIPRDRFTERRSHLGRRRERGRSGGHPRRHRLQAARLDVPVRCAPRSRGGRRRDGRCASCCGLVAVDDSGRILNPLIAEGQRQGGIAQGVAQALYEEVRYDEDGNPVTSNFADYAIPSAAELPNFELDPDGDADPAQRAGSQRHRRVRHDRGHAGGAERSRGCARPSRRSPRGSAAHPRAGLAIDRGSWFLTARPTAENGRRRRSMLLHAVRQGSSCPTGQILRISQPAFGAALDPGTKPFEESCCAHHLCRSRCPP